MRAQRRARDLRAGSGRRAMPAATERAALGRRAARRSRPEPDRRGRPPHGYVRFRRRGFPASSERKAQDSPN